MSTQTLLSFSFFLFAFPYSHLTANRKRCRGPHDVISNDLWTLWEPLISALSLSFTDFDRFLVSSLLEAISSEETSSTIRFTQIQWLEKICIHNDSFAQSPTLQKVLISHLRDSNSWTIKSIEGIVGKMAFADSSILELIHLAKIIHQRDSRDLPQVREDDVKEMEERLGQFIGEDSFDESSIERVPTEVSVPENTANKTIIDENYVGPWREFPAHQWRPCPFGLLPTS